MKPSTRLLIPILFTSFSLLSTISHATTDWTPKFQPMLDGCHYADISYNLEPVYKSAIVKQSTKVDDKNNEESPTYITTLLKHSVAFGLPITRFKTDSNDGAYTQNLYFSSADFMKLRPLFKLPDMSGEDSKSLKNNKLGYSIGMTSLQFNIKQSSISCSGYAS